MLTVLVFFFDFLSVSFDFRKSYEDLRSQWELV